MYQVYEPESGRILATVTVEPEVAEYMMKRGDSMIEGEGNDLENFVDLAASPRAVKKRPVQNTRQSVKNIAADGSELMTLSALPVPCRVEVDGEGYEVKDGIFEWGTRLPGVYVFRVVAFPFLDWEGTVTAV